MAGLAQTTPPWVALTAYLAGARVTPVTSNGLNWYATVGGTSAAAEPVWPTTDPWTIVDGTVTWRLATSFRQMTTAAVLATCNAFKLANPWALPGSVLGARPKSYSNMSLPGIFVDSMDETVAHFSGVRTRTFTGLTAVLVVQAPDNAQTSNYTDAIVDGLMDAFTAAFHAIDGSSILQLTSVTEVPLDEGVSSYVGEVFSFAVTAKTEGRN